MTVSIEVRKRCLWRRRHTSICGAMFWFLMERPRGGVASPGPSRVLGPRGVIPKQDALNQSPPVGRVPEAAAVTQRSPGASRLPLQARDRGGVNAIRLGDN
jgi:hypothetical protein